MNFRRIKVAVIAIALAAATTPARAQQPEPEWRAAAGIGLVNHAANYNPDGYVVSAITRISRQLSARKRWALDADLTWQRAVVELGGGCVSLDFYPPCTPTVYGHVAWAVGLAPALRYEWPLGKWAVVTRASAGLATGHVDHLSPIDKPFDFTSGVWGGAVGLRRDRWFVELVGSQFSNVRAQHPNTWSLQVGVAW